MRIYQLLEFQEEVLDATTDTGTGVTVDIEVGAANTSVGIGSTSYEVVNFKIK